MAGLSRRQSVPDGTHARRRVSPECVLHHVQTTPKAGLRSSVELELAAADWNQLGCGSQLCRNQYHSRPEWDRSESRHIFAGRQLSDCRKNIHAVLVDRKYEPAAAVVSR